MVIQWRNDVLIMCAFHMFVIRYYSLLNMLNTQLGRPFIFCFTSTLKHKNYLAHQRIKLFLTDRCHTNRFVIYETVHIEPVLLGKVNTMVSFGPVRRNVIQRIYVHIFSPNAMCFIKLLDYSIAIYNL